MVTVAPRTPTNTIGDVFFTGLQARSGRGPGCMRCWGATACTGLGIGRPKPARPNSLSECFVFGTRRARRLAAAWRKPTATQTLTRADEHANRKPVSSGRPNGAVGKYAESER